MVPRSAIAGEAVKDEADVDLLTSQAAPGRWCSAAPATTPSPGTGLTGGRGEAAMGTLRAMHHTLPQLLGEVREAHHARMRGVSYEDTVAAALRVLCVRRMLERATGRPETTEVTTDAIATLLPRRLQ